MKEKGIKLIVGIVLIIVGIVLYLLEVLNPWLCLAIGVVGLIFFILFFKKEEGEKKEFSPSESPKEPVKEELEEEKQDSEPVEVGAGGSENEGNDEEKPSM